MSQAENGNNTKGGLPALVYKGEVIHERHEMLSLTDMWKAAGSDAARQPAEWSRSADAARFIEFLTLSHNLGNSQVMKTRQGKGGGTWAHWQIAMAYAKYLDPEFHMWCNTVVRQRMEGAPRFDHLIAEDLGRDARSAIGGIVKSVVPGLLAEALTIILPAMVKEQVLERQHAVVQGVSAGQVIVMAGVVQRKGLHGLAAWVSTRLRRFHADKGVVVRIASLGSRSAYVFDPFTSREWLSAGGRVEIERRIAERRGQLRLV